MQSNNSNAELCTVGQTNNRKKQIQIYNSIVKSTVTYEAQSWKFNQRLESEFIQMEMDFFEKKIGEIRKI